MPQGVRGVPDNRSAEVSQPLILRRPLDVVDDEDVDGSVGGLELKAKLTLEGSAEGRGDVADVWIDRRAPVKCEVVQADEAGLIDNGTRDGCHAGHSGERGGEQPEGNAATAEAAVRVVGG
jgi:hypothetical protein